MRKPNCLFVLLLTLFCQVPFSFAQQEQFALSSEFRMEAISELRNNLRNEQRWSKVHAAEYLLQLGYPQEVKAIFEKERTKYGKESQYRIGIWRVLAQASLPGSIEEEKWIQKISSAFTNQEGRDRIHAIEALAKLKVIIPDTDSKLVQAILNGKDDLFRAYTLWGLTINGEKKSLEHLIQLLQEPDETTKKIAAYALRFLQNIPAEHWPILTTTALTEPDSSSAKTYLLSAALVNTPEAQLNSSLYLQIRENLLQETSSGIKANRYELCEALAHVGKIEDLPILKNLLQDTILDVRSAAANAILRIDRRQAKDLAILDWLVLGIYFIGMLLIGWYYASRSKSSEDYFLGGRSMNPIMVGLSLFASLLSTLSYLSYPGEMIKYGPTVFGMVLAFPLIHFVVGWYLIPKFMQLKVTSAYEILEKKLGLSIRMLATVFFLSLRFLWMATIVYATVETAIVPMFDLNPGATLYISIGIALITIIYTSLGGFKAVVLTDVLQFVILFGGAILTVLMVSIHFGSLTAWLPTEFPRHWEQIKYGLDAGERMTVGNIILMLLLWYICTTGSDQMAIQRYLATKDVTAARKTLGMALLANTIVIGVLALVGLAVLQYFQENPHQLVDGTNFYDSADSLFPRFILVGLPMGFTGLVTVGLLSAAMSSLSSGLNAASSVFYEDFVQRFSKRNRTEPLKIIRFISFLVGGLIVLLSSFVGLVEGNLLEVIIRVVNLFTAPLFVLFFMALFVPFATTTATFIAGIISALTAIAISFFQIFGIQVLWILPSALIVGISTGILLSLAENSIKPRI